MNGVIDKRGRSSRAERVEKGGLALGYGDEITEKRDLCTTFLMKVVGNRCTYKKKKGVREKKKSEGGCGGIKSQGKNGVEEG